MRESKDLAMGVFEGEDVPASGGDLGVVPLKLIENWVISSIEIEVSEITPTHNDVSGVHSSIAESRHCRWHI